MTSLSRCPAAAFSSGYACRRLDEGYRKVELLLSVGAHDLAAQQVAYLNRVARYLRTNFTAAALARGAVQG